MSVSYSPQLLRLDPPVDLSWVAVVSGILSHSCFAVSMSGKQTALRHHQISGIQSGSSHRIFISLVLCSEGPNFKESAVERTG